MTSSRRLETADVIISVEIVGWERLADSLKNYCC